PIKPQVGISPRMRACIDAALKLLSAPRWLASRTKRRCSISGSAMPTSIIPKPTVAAMNVGEPIYKDTPTNLRHKQHYYEHCGMAPLTTLTARGRVAQEREIDDQRRSHFPH